MTELSVRVADLKRFFPKQKKSFAEKCFGLEKQFMEKQKKVSRNFVSRMLYLSFVALCGEIHFTSYIFHFFLFLSHEIP